MVSITIQNNLLSLFNQAQDTINIFFIGFTYQLLFKPYILTVDRTQFIIGNLVYDEARKYNSGLVLLKNELHFFIGNNFYDLTNTTDSKPNIYI